MGSAAKSNRERKARRAAGLILAKPTASHYTRTDLAVAIAQDKRRGRSLLISWQEIMRSMANAAYVRPI